MSPLPVIEVLRLILFDSTTLVSCGNSFPLFYIQLDAIKRGLDSNFSFYTVGIRMPLFSYESLAHTFLLALDPQRYIHIRSRNPRILYKGYWHYEYASHHWHRVRSTQPSHDFREDCRRFYDFCHLFWLLLWRM